MILATRHVGIVVQDIDTCLRFWRDVMGLKIVADFQEQGGFIDTVQALKGVRLRMVKLSAPDGSTIELLKDHGHPTPPPEQNRLCDRGLRHVAFTVADVSRTWQVLSQGGHETLSEPVSSPDGKARLFFARDPEGNLIEIVQPM